MQFYGDKGYNSGKNIKLLISMNLHNRILKKAKKNWPLKAIEKSFNKLCGKTRFKVESTFGSIRSWFRSKRARYPGIAKTSHTEIKSKNQNTPNDSTLIRNYRSS